MPRTKLGDRYDNMVDLAYETAMLETIRSLRGHLRMRRKQHKRVDFQFVDSLLTKGIRRIYREPIHFTRLIPSKMRNPR